MSAVNYRQYSKNKLNKVVVGYEFEDTFAWKPKKKCKKRSKKFNVSSKVKDFKHEVSGKAQRTHTRSCYIPKRPTNRQMRRSVACAIERERIRVKKQKAFNDVHYSTLRKKRFLTKLAKVEEYTKKQFPHVDKIGTPSYVHRKAVALEVLDKSDIGIAMKEHNALPKDLKSEVVNKIHVEGRSIAGVSPVVGGTIDEELRKKLKSGKSPQLLWHGTAESNIESMKRIGIVPGGTNGVAVRHGRAHGTGVYVGKTFQTSSAYAVGNIYSRGIVLLCAAFVEGAVTERPNFLVIPPGKSSVIPLIACFCNLSQSRSQNAAPAETRKNFTALYTETLNIFEQHLKKKTDYMNLIGDFLVSQTSLNIKGETIPFSQLAW